MKKSVSCKTWLFCASLSVLGSCAKPVVLSKLDSTITPPPAPDYSLSANWAALPTQTDFADRIPINANSIDNQQAALADVFFIHPTIFTSQPAQGSYEWNADVNDSLINKRVDGTTILNQATIFNGSCRVYAPRYRQAHYYAFITQDKADKQAALDLAYSDVKVAFDYYLQHYHQNRPFIIASHSQGTLHAKRLIQEMVDGKPLQKRFVFAYLVGMPIQADDFQQIKPAQSPESVGGFASWNTFTRGFYPDYYTNGYQTAACTNPLTWKTDAAFAPKDLNKGGVGLKFTMQPQLADAQVNKGILWINKPYVRGRALLRNNIWHVADMNLFWQNIRDNVALRIENFLDNDK